MDDHETDSDLVRWGTLALGVGLVLFSAPAIPAPRFFGRLAGLPISDDPRSAVAFHSVALRDIVMGVGLISAALHGARLAPWLLIRTLCDGGDALAIGWALWRGGTNRRLAGLGVVALVAAVYDAVLYRLARQQD